MSTTLLQQPKSRTPAEVLFEISGDLDHLGRLGSSRLVVTTEELVRYENTPAGEQVVSVFKLKELFAPSTEQLVDAVALVATQNGRQVELIRGTNTRNLIMSDAVKRLKLLLDGKPLPPLGDIKTVCPKCGRPLGEDGEGCPFCIDRGKTLLRMFGYTAGLRGRLVWGTVLTLLGVVVRLAQPKLTQVLVDDVFRGGNWQYFNLFFLAIVATYIATMFIQIGRNRNVAYLGMEITVRIREQLFEKLQALSLNFYDKRNVGSIMSRMTNDTGAMYDVLVDGIPVLLQQFILLVAIPIALLVMNWRVAIWTLVPIPIVLYAVRWFRKRMHVVWSRFWHNWSRLGGMLNGILQGTRVVKAFYGESREVSRFDRRITDLSRTQYMAEASWATFFPIVQFTMAISTIVTWWVGGGSVHNNILTVGQLLAFVGYVAMLQEPLMALQRIMDWTTRSLTAAERVFEIMDLPEDIVDAPDAVPMPDIKGGLVFRDVHFGYDKSREVLHGIDLDVKPGELIGLVGHSGAGKSTLINLLMRFYDPTQGEIVLDGVDLRKVKLEDFRRQVGVVLQESYLFPGSIRYNIAYGRPQATLEEVIEAAKAANAHKFIINFPDGYDTYVGERGQRLSGGERQRISIARAILHNPKILVLDEATASVDTETERMIQQALERLISGRTVFAIAHRLSTLRNAHRLVVIDEGQVAEMGTHAELLAKPDGIYKKLVDMQMEMNSVTDNFFEA
jgi:ATP-binding cassette subfamily B protein